LFCGLGMPTFREERGYQLKGGKKKLGKKEVVERRIFKGAPLQSIQKNNNFRVATKRVEPRAKGKIGLQQGETVADKTEGGSMWKKGAPK